MSSAFSSCCVSGHLHEGTPKGSYKTINGLSTYVTGDEANSNKTIVYITDIFGIKLINALLLADEFASNGFYVLVPDLLEGDCIDHNLLLKIAPRSSLPSRSEEQAQKDGEDVMKDLGPWLGNHPHDKIWDLVKGFVESLKQDGKKIGATGYCWGGRYSILLAGKEGLVDAAIACHPSFLQVPDEVENITKPVFIAVGDKDEMLPPPAQDAVQNIFKDLNKKGVETKFEVYKNHVHGFSVRGDINEPWEKEAKEKVTKEGVDFFQKYLS